MLILRRLLSSYPFKKSLLFCECCHDIPPLYRANLWSALLNIYWDVEKRFIAIDTFSPHTSDRQLLVDIPRCHQVMFSRKSYIEACFTVEFLLLFSVAVYYVQSN